MGKIGFTPIQKLIFDAFAQEEISSHFYFTGGTALSVFYLQHRLSDDLDFFTESEFEDNVVLSFVDKIAAKLTLKSRFTRRDAARIFEFVKDGKLLIKVDFVHHPYKRLEKGKRIGKLEIDSLRDIATNKLLTINQRNDVKDFVDLYYLLKKYTIWDLLYGVEVKYRMDLDMVLIASDFLKVDNFPTLPRMIKPIKLTELKKFFRERAKEIGRKITI